MNLAAGPVTALSIAAYAASFVASLTRRPWLAPVAALIAIAHLLVSAAWGESGFFSPEGEITWCRRCWFAWVGLGRRLSWRAPLEWRVVART